MSMDFQLPHITGETVPQQVSQIVSYLRQLALQLQMLPEPVEKTAEASPQERSNVFPTLQIQGSLNGVYLRRVPVSNSADFRIRTALETWTGAGIGRQSLFLWGNLGDQPLEGLILADDGGGCTWEGTEGITLFKENGGILGIRLSQQIRDPLIIQSAKPFSIL